MITSELQPRPLDSPDGPPSESEEERRLLHFAELFAFFLTAAQRLSAARRIFSRASALILRRLPFFTGAFIAE